MATGTESFAARPSPPFVHSSAESPLVGHPRVLKGSTASGHVWAISLLDIRVAPVEGALQNMHVAVVARARTVLLPQAGRPREIGFRPMFAWGKPRMCPGTAASGT